MGQIGSTPGILILRKGQDGCNRSLPLRKKADIFMPMKITRQRSAGLFGTAAASVWVRPVFGESYEAAEWFNRLIGASTSQRLGEGKTFRAFTTPLGCIRFWEYR